MAELEQQSPSRDSTPGIGKCAKRCVRSKGMSAAGGAPSSARPGSHISRSVLVSQVFCRHLMSQLFVRTSIAAVGSMASRPRGDRFAQLRALPIRAVAMKLGIKRPAKSMRCPLPGHEDRHPSFAFFFQTNTWKCFGCGRGGSAIDLVAAVLECSVAEAANWLDSGQDRLLIANPAGQITDDTGFSGCAASTPDPQIYRALLSMSPLSRAARDYLHSRGFSDATIAHFHLGYLATAPSVLFDLIRLFGRSRLHRAGLLSSRRAARLTLPSNSIVFPFLSGQHVNYLQCRLMPDAKGPRWMGLSGIKKPVFNSDIIQSAKTIYVCEGATDVLSAHELGVSAIGLLGSASRVAPDLLNVLARRTVFVVPDNDPAGAAMLKAFIVDLERVGGKAIEKKVPMGSDLNDYLVLKQKTGAGRATRGSGHHCRDVHHAASGAISMDSPRRNGL